MEEIDNIIRQFIEVEDIDYKGNNPIYYGILRGSFHKMKKELEKYNVAPFLSEDNEGRVKISLSLMKKPKQEKRIINLILFITTIFTTIWVGAILQKMGNITSPSDLILGLPFSFTLLLILGSHELGHYFACKRLGVSATLPYFIPVPPPSPLGTFGAVIRIKSPIEDKKGLLEVGAAGPLVGLVFAIPIIIIGFKLTHPIPISSIKNLEEAGHITFGLGSSILTYFLSKLFLEVPKEGYTLMLNPVGFSGWIGLFVTAMNLLPIGQLDGGHIAYAIFGKAHKWIAFAMIGTLIILGIKFWPGFAVWAVLVLILGVRHPPPLNSMEPLDLSHKIIGIISIIAFIITFVPNPFIFG
jgi:membrane-associated protease RseP (regulator of RpoE activity)